MNLTVREAARLLRVSEKTLFRWITEGRLPVRRVQDQYRFNRVELLEWATAQNLPVDEVDAQPAAPNALADALARGGVHYQVPGTTREEVLRHVVDHLAQPLAADAEFIYQAMLAREEIGTTAIGGGLAIPHMRNPMVLAVEVPLVTLSFLAHPVDFQARDRKPVFALFSMISPTVRSHLRMLVRMSGALRDAAFKAAVSQRLPQEALLSVLREAEARLDQHDAIGRTKSEEPA